MFIVGWQGSPPQDKKEWIEILTDVLVGCTGAYRIRFYPGAKGWKFECECREDLGFQGEEVVGNSPDSIRFNIYHALTTHGKPLDPSWKD